MLIPAAENNKGKWQETSLLAFQWVQLQPRLLARLHLQGQKPPWVEIYSGATVVSESRSERPQDTHSPRNTYEFTVDEQKIEAFGFELKVIRNDGRYILCLRRPLPYTGTGD